MLYKRIKEGGDECLESLLLRHKKKPGLFLL